MIRLEPKSVNQLIKSISTNPLGLKKRDTKLQKRNDSLRKINYMKVWKVK